MPRFDRTGPRGAGPRTGRGLGDCNDKPINPRIKRTSKDGIRVSPRLGRNRTNK